MVRIKKAKKCRGLDEYLLAREHGAESSGTLSTVWAGSHFDVWAGSSARYEARRFECIAGEIDGRGHTALRAVEDGLAKHERRVLFGAGNMCRAYMNAMGRNIRRRSLATTTKSVGERRDGHTFYLCQDTGEQGIDGLGRVLEGASGNPL